MMKIKKIPKLQFKFKSYFRILQVSFFYPQLYAISIPQKKKLNFALFFFFINLSLGFILKQVFESILRQNLNLALFAISQFLIFIPLTLIGLILFTFLLFLIAKILGGKGSLQASFNAVCFSSAPLVLFWIPLLNLFALVESLYIAIINFRSLHDFSYFKAIFTVIFPFVATLFIVLIMGVGSFLEVFFLGNILREIIKNEYFNYFRFL